MAMKLFPRAERLIITDFTGGPGFRFNHGR
jgi:hypothetical protein